MRRMLDLVFLRVSSQGGADALPGRLSIFCEATLDEQVNISLCFDERRKEKGYFLENRVT